MQNLFLVHSGGLKTCVTADYTSELLSRRGLVVHRGGHSQANPGPGVAPNGNEGNAKSGAVQIWHLAGSNAPGVINL